MKKERGLALAACAALAALMLLFASQCSPLYPINLWDDANCLLTVGRVMRRGGVLYRDIYEQKGPLLYLIHALAACVSDTSFWGVYVLEIPALTAALYAAYRLLRLRTGAGFALGAAAVWGALTVTGGAFMRGDSAEEFCLPLLTAALALAYAEYGRRARPMRAKRLLLCGVLAGGIATIKYTLLGAMVGLCAVEGALALKEGGAPRALKSAGVFLAGMAIPILPWVIYFAANGALRDAYTAYIYNNVFLYGGEAASWGQRLGELARYVQKNALWAVPAALGLAALAADWGETAAVRLCVAAMAAGQFAAVFFVGRVWAYSLLALAAFGVIGCMQLRGQKLEQLAQGRLAAAMPEGATLLQYSHLDDGLYLAAHTLPREKYFVLLNVQLEAMRDALDRAVRKAVPDYVLVSWRELPAEFDRYELIASDVGYDDDNRLNKTLYLYRRKSE